MTIRNPSASLRARRAQHARYKADVQKKGKPFYPYAMFHDTVMSLIVVLVIIALACVWKWSTPGDHTGTGAGWLGPLYSDKADPGTTSFVPRPDWYFYFLFYLLRIFKWPDSVILGNRRDPDDHHGADARAPVRGHAAGAAAVAAPGRGRDLHPDRDRDGHADLQGRDREGGARERGGRARCPAWVKKNDLPAAAVPGAKLFAQSGCLTCHTYLGTGSSNLGAPDLSAEGAKNKGVQFQVNHLKCPSCVNPGSPMPSFASLGDDNLRKIAVFLEASKGGK